MELCIYKWEREYSHEAGQVGQLIDEVKQLANVVGYGRAVGIHSLQVLLVDLAHSCKKHEQRSSYTAYLNNFNETHVHEMAIQVLRNAFFLEI